MVTFVCAHRVRVRVRIAHTRWALGMVWGYYGLDNGAL